MFVYVRAQARGVAKASCVCCAWACYTLKLFLLKGREGGCFERTLNKSSTGTLLGAWQSVSECGSLGLVRNLCVAW